MELIKKLFDRQWWRFQWRYFKGQTPWDTNITPPEVTAFLETARPARALDLGCGTGTNAISMATLGWQVTGIDYAPKAIAMARRKAARAGLVIDFRVGDVSRMPLDEGHFDYILDIGCLHTLDAGDHPEYAQRLKKILAPGGTYMLYAWMPRLQQGRMQGLTVEQVHGLFTPELNAVNTVVGEERNSPTVWYWFKKS
jgi:SAM-dependent methyltransferase